MGSGDWRTRRGRAPAASAQNTVVRTPAPVNPRQDDFSYFKTATVCSYLCFAEALQVRRADYRTGVLWAIDWTLQSQFLGGPWKFLEMKEETHNFMPAVKRSASADVVAAPPSADEPVMAITEQAGCRGQKADPRVNFSLKCALSLLFLFVRRLANKKLSPAAAAAAPLICPRELRSQPLPWRHIQSRHLEHLRLPRTFVTFPDAIQYRHHRVTTEKYEISKFSGLIGGFPGQLLNKRREFDRMHALSRWRNPARRAPIKHRGFDPRSRKKVFAFLEIHFTGL